MNPKYLLPVLLLLTSLCLPGAFAEDQKTFTNPIAQTGADPWVVRWENNYVYCYSRHNKIWVNKAEKLEDIDKNKPAVVWTPQPGTDYSKELWAPELHYLHGKWYIYVAADDGNNHNHRMIVLEGSTQNPQEAFHFKGKISAPTDRWAIDGTVLTLPGQKMYFIWSGWEGTENVQQNLYIAPMSNPWTLSGERVCISKPELEWELNGTPLINEGPEVLKNGEHIFIIYSASGSWTDDYCLGQLTLTGTNPMNPNAWIKKPIPVFSRTETVYGPGHASFVTSPSGKENWIVYHAAKHSGAGWNRHVCIQPFTWNKDASPNFGTPHPTGEKLPVPE